MTGKKSLNDQRPSNTPPKTGSDKQPQGQKGQGRQSDEQAVDRQTDHASPGKKKSS